MNIIEKYTKRIDKFTNSLTNLEKACERLESKILPFLLKRRRLIRLFIKKDQIRKKDNPVSTDLVKRSDVKPGYRKPRLDTRG